MSAIGAAAAERANRARFPGWLTAGVLGLCWGIVIHLLGGVALTLITGVAMAPALGAAAVAGGVSGLVVAWRPVSERTGPFLAIVAFLTLAVLLALSFAAPYNQALSAKRTSSAP